MLRLAGILPVLLLTYQLVAQAELVISRQEDPSSCVDCRFQRTLFNIVWGCVSTTIICAWAAIHPNIPPREGPFKKTLRRLELMFWTVVAPEILPCWALNQLLAAITVRDVYNKRKGYEKQRNLNGIWEAMKGWFSLYEIKDTASEEWTRTHGHFLIMGGFHVVEPPDESDDERSEANIGTQRTVSDTLDVLPTSALLVKESNMDFGKGNGRSGNKARPEGRVTVLTLELLRKLVDDDPEFRIRITEEQIADRSKGDALSKIIFILQSTWFILQCLGRRAQGLNLTQLELTTLALASLNGVTFVLWWDKPLGAQTTVPVYLKRKLTDSERVPLRVGESRSMRSDLVATIQEMFEFCATTISDAFFCRPEGLIPLPFAILLLLTLPIVAFAFAFFATLMDLVMETSTFFSPDDTHVPTFYVPKHRYSEWYHVFLLVTLGAIFGGIHCSGWNFSFPTDAEQKLWRIASLIVTVIPIAIFPFSFVIDSLDKWLSPTFKPFANVPGILTILLCALAYVSARLILLGLALSLLRHLPPAAFIAVDWTMFYPHFL